MGKNHLIFIAVTNNTPDDLLVEQIEYCTSGQVKCLCDVPEDVMKELYRVQSSKERPHSFFKRMLMCIESSEKHKVDETEVKAAIETIARFKTQKEERRKRRSKNAAKRARSLFKD